MLAASGTGWFRASSRDAWVLGAAVLHGAMVVTMLAVCALEPGAGGVAVVVKALSVLALGGAMNWASNTISHIHLHGPLFRQDVANRAFSLYLSVLLAVPQGWWKSRHLSHHQSPERCRASVRVALRRQGAWELGVLLVAWGALAAAAPALFAGVVLPAMALGLGLCAIQGHQEHARSAPGVDVHASLYNRLWFNDGFHAAHHRSPEAHWTTLPARAAASDVTSMLPPTLRWLERAPALANRVVATVIDTLERSALRLPPARHYLLRTHRRAWERLFGDGRVDTTAIREIAIVGGGLFPRTALILGSLLPQARVTIIEAVPANAACARRFLAGTGAAGARFVEGALPDHADARAVVAACDLLVLPLAFRGDRAGLYARPPAPLVAIHDWLWRVRGDDRRGVRVSLALLKRLNLVAGPPARRSQGSQVEAVQVHATAGAGSVAQPPAASAGTS